MGDARAVRTRMAITHTLHTNGRVLGVSGEVDVATADRLKEAVTQALAESSADRVVLDLSEVSFMDSSGLAALVHAHKAAEEQRTSLVVSSPTSRLSRILDLTGLDRVLRVTATVDEALEVTRTPGHS